MVNKKAEKDDEGKYAITLSNEKGFDTVNVHVTIVGKFDFLPGKYFG